MIEFLAYLGAVMSTLNFIVLMAILTRVDSLECRALATEADHD